MIGARFASGQDFTLDQQLTLFDIEIELSQIRRRKYAGDARAVVAGTDQVGRGAAAEQQAQSVDK